MTDQIALGDRQLAELRRLARRQKLPVEQLVQQAVSDFLVKQRDQTRDSFESGFGLWGEGEDGLAYQQRLRSEW